MHCRAIDWVARFVYYVYMTNEELVAYHEQTGLSHSTAVAHACRVLNMAALESKSREQAIDILREAAVRTQLSSASWDMLVHAGQYLKRRTLLVNSIFKGGK